VELYKKEKEARNKNRVDSLFKKVSHLVFLKYPKLKDFGELSLCYGHESAYLSIDSGDLTSYAFGRICKKIDGLNIPKIFTKEGLSVLTFSAPKKFNNKEIWDILKDIAKEVDRRASISILCHVAPFRKTMWTGSKNGRFFMFNTHVQDLGENLIVSQCETIDMSNSFIEIEEWEKIKIESEYNNKSQKEDK